jgi:hypothetical protein|nr:MAG TPA: hypothetical protein [Caudoviricetes sp.]
MILWIRTQDREDLRPQPSLSIEKVEHSVTGKMWYIVNNINLDEAQTLGTYRTKNRALEILDEIQNLLENAYTGTSNIIVYKMPKE